MFGHRPMIEIADSKVRSGGERLNTKALRQISYGLYVIGSMKEGKINGQIANTGSPFSES